MRIDTFTDVVDDCSLSALEGQLRLVDLTEAERVGAGFQLDLAAGEFEFRGESGERLTARGHLIGTASPGDGTWLWAWHNLNDLPESAVRLAGRVRDFGRQYRVPELTEAFQPLREGPREDAARYASVATVICGGLPHYVFDAGNGTVVAVLLESERFRPGPPSVVRAATVIQQLLQQGAIRDWPRALASYAELRGFGHRPEADGAATLSAPDGHLTVSFDQLRRIASIKGQFKAAPEG